MKRFLALLVAMAMVFVLAGFAVAEESISPHGFDVRGTVGEDGHSWREGYINSVFMEGQTSNDFETELRSADATADRVITLPDATGTVALTGDISTTMALADAKILIGNSGGLATEQTMSGDGSITNGGVFSIEAGTDAQLMVYNAGDGWGPDTMSGDVTIDNALVATIGNNKIGLAESNWNTVSVGVATGQTSGTAVVTTGSREIGGAYAFANIDDEIANITAISGQTLTVTLISAVTGASVVYKVSVIEP